MTCDSCGYWAFRDLGNGLLKCLRCGDTQRSSDSFECEVCGEDIPNEEGVNHYYREHPELKVERGGRR